MASKTTHAHPAWLDGLAISMSLICGIHCLLTPVLLVALPILATTFWVDANFHWWMVLLVLPTAGTSIFLGCRRHRDAWTIRFASFGFGLIVFAAWYCSGLPFSSSGSVAHVHSPWSLSSLVTSLGGLSMVIAHVRNFRLCRKADCGHGH